MGKNIVAKAPDSRTSINPTLDDLEINFNGAAQKLALEHSVTTSDQKNQQVPAADADGPLLLTLLMGNNNNNKQAQTENDAYIAAHPPPIPDTLQVMPQRTFVELLPYEETSQQVDSSHRMSGSVTYLPSSSTSERRKTRGVEAALLLTLLMGNNNNNKQAQTGNDAYIAANSPPIPDTLQVKPQQAFIELSQNEEPVRKVDDDNMKAMLATQIRSFVASQSRKMLSVDTQTQELPLLEQSSGLSSEQLASWGRNGYLVIEEALSESTLNDLVANIMETVERLFDVKDPRRVCHFVDATTKVDFNPNGRVIASLTDESSGQTLEPLQRVSRIGTGVHRLSAPFRAATFTAKNYEIARSLGYQDPRVPQSIIVIKAPRVGPEVIPHQDGCSNFTNPPSCVTFWYALQDATAQNGCLMVKPGSHRTPITERCKINDKGFPELFPIEEPVFAKINSTEEPDVIPDDENGFKKLEVRAGTLVLMHGNLVHASEANRSEFSRIAYNFGVTEGGLPWEADNCLQPYDGETEFERLEPKD